MPSQRTPDRVRFGRCELDLSSGELARDGHRVLLSDQPFRLLTLLVRKRGALVTRDTLRRELWSDDTFVDFEAGLNAAVKRLREALGDAATAPSYIETLPRRGYRFIAEVEEPPEAGEDGAPAHAIGAHPPEAAPVSRPAEAGRPRAVFALAGGLVLTVLAIMVAVIPWLRRPRSDERRRGPRSGMTRVTNLGTVLLASLSPDGRDLVYVSSEGVQESLWVRRRDSGDAVRLLGPLEGNFQALAFAPKGVVYYTFFSPDRTDIALHRLSIEGGPPEVVLEAAGAMAFTPDGARYAYVKNLSMTLGESRVVLVDAQSGSTRVLNALRTPETYKLQPAWSPDNTHLAILRARHAEPGHHQIIDIEVDTGATRRIADLDLAEVNGLLWRPDGRELIVSGRQRRATPLRLWSVPVEAGTVRPMTDDVSDYNLVGLAEGGAQVLATRLEATRSLWTVEVSAPDRATRVTEDAGGLNGFDDVAWAPDGELVYTLTESDNADIWSIDPGSGHRRRLTTDPSDDFQACVSPDGQTVVFASNRGRAVGLWAMSRDGSRERRLTTAGTFPAFSPDDTWVAFQRAGVETTPWAVFRVWLQTGEVRRITVPSTMRPAVSPDGRLVAHYWMTPERWAFGITPVEGGLPARTFAVEPTHAARYLRWAPDGRALAFIDQDGGASNVVLQPLDGGPRRKLTGFAEGTISTFDWSRDGRRLALMRVHQVGDVVAISLDAVVRAETQASRE